MKDSPFIEAKEGEFTHRFKLYFNREITIGELSELRKRCEENMWKFFDRQIKEWEEDKEDSTILTQGAKQE